MALVLGLELSLRTHLKSLALALKVESLTLALALKVGSLALALKVESLLALILNIFINFYLTALQCSLKNVL